MPFNPEANQEAEDANITKLRELEQQLLWQISDAEKTGAADEVRDLQERLAEVREEIKQWQENRKQSATETDSNTQPLQQGGSGDGDAAAKAKQSKEIAREELNRTRQVLGMGIKEDDRS